MGIQYYDVELLSNLFSALGNYARDSLLSFGAQDCYFTYEQLVDFLKRKGLSHHEIPPEWILPTAGLNWTSGKLKDEGFIHQKTMFAVLGWDINAIHALDISNYEGADIIHDLNSPIPNSLAGQFDFVFDGGTVEHVFSIKDALFNAASLLRSGGIVVHHSPFDWANHGLVNINPKLFRDFYMANGFEEIDVKFVASREGDPFDYRILSPSAVRDSLRPRYRLSIFGAFRKTVNKPLRVPLEGIYRRLFAGRVVI